MKVIFDLDWLVAKEVEEEVKSLLSPHGKVTAMKATNRIEVLETAGNLRRIRDYLAEEQSSRTLLVREFPLKYTRADDVAETLRKILGLKSESTAPLTPEQQKQQAQLAAAQARAAQQAGKKGQAQPQEKEPEVHLAVDDRKNSILVTGPRKSIVIVEQAIQVIDVPEAAAFGGPDALPGALGKPRLSIYHLSAVSPEAVVSVLKEMGELQPRTRLEVDDRSKSIIAYATPEDHVTIRSFVDRIDGTGRHFEVIQLRQLDAESAAGSIEVLMKGKPDESNSGRRYRYYYSDYSRSSSSTQKDPSDEFQIEADIEQNRLLLRATDVEIAEVKKLLVKLGEHPEGTANTSTLRTIPVSPTHRESLLRAIQEMWPNVKPENELRIVPSPDRRSRQKSEEKDEGEPSKQSDGESVARRPGRNRIDYASAEANGHGLPAGSARVLAVAENADEDTKAREADGDEAFPEAQSPPRAPQTSPDSGPPVTIVPGEEGLVIMSPDSAALDMLERLVASLAPAESDFTVFRLRHAYATDAAYILEDMFEDKDDSNSGYRSYWDYWYWGRSDEKKSTGSRLSKRKPLKIIADPATNSLFVRASPEQLAEVEAMLNIIDSPPPADADSTRIPQLIPVYNTTAKEVAAIVKELYRDYLSEYDPARGKRAETGPRNVSRYSYTTIIGGSNSSSDKKKAGMLSVGVDERTNTLIVSAPKKLFLQVQQIVHQLDEQAVQPRQIIRVVNLETSTPVKSVKEVLSSVVGEKKPTRPEKPEEKEGEKGEEESRKRTPSEVEAVLN